MAEKILNTRILMKVDSLENWASSSLKLKNGELAFATVAASAGTGLTEPVVMVKIGTAEEKTFSELPWAFHAKASDVLAACKTEAGLKAFVNSVISDAGIASSSAMEALAGRVTTVENDLNTATTGLKARMTTAEGAIDALELLVGEKNVATQIQEAIAALKLGDTYEVKGEAAKVQTALNEYKTTNDAAVQKNASDITGEIARAKAAEETNTNAINAIKDGTTIDSFKDVEDALAGKEAAGEAAKAQAAAEAHADSLNTAMDTRVKAVEGKAHEHTNKAELDKIAEGDKAKWDAMEQNAKDYTDAEIEEWVGEKTVATQITEAIAAEKLAETYAAKVHKHVKADITDFAHTHEISEVNGLSNAIADAKKAGTDAQGEVDALETYVGVIPEGYTEESVIAYINKKAEETLASASGNSTETAASVKAALDTYKTENNAKVQANTDAIDAIEADYLKAADKTALQDQIDALDTLVGDESVSKQITDVTDPLAGRVKAIEDDYLKAADKTELTNAIATAKQEAIATVLGQGVDEDFDTLKEVADWILSDTTGAAALQTDVAAIKADYLKAADKTELEGKITTAQNAADKAQGEVDALEGVVATKAAQADLESLAGRVSTVEGDLNTETTGLKAKMAAAEAAIEALQGKHDEEKTVAEQIAAVTDSLGERIEDLEAVDHEHSNKTVLDSISAEKVSAWDAAVQTVTAGTGLTATKTGTDVAIGFDDSVTFVFDCGDSTNV